MAKKRAIWRTGSKNVLLCPPRYTEALFDPNEYCRKRENQHAAKTENKEAAPFFKGSVSVCGCGSWVLRAFGGNFRNRFLGNGRLFFFAEHDQFPDQVIDCRYKNDGDDHGQNIGGKVHSNKPEWFITEVVERDGKKHRKPEFEKIGSDAGDHERAELQKRMFRAPCPIAEYQNLVRQKGEENTRDPSRRLRRGAERRACPDHGGVGGVEIYPLQGREGVEDQRSDAVGDKRGRESHERIDDEFPKIFPETFLLLRHDCSMR